MKSAFGGFVGVLVACLPFMVFWLFNEFRTPISFVVVLFLTVLVFFPLGVMIAGKIGGK